MSDKKPVYMLIREIIQKETGIKLSEDKCKKVATKVMKEVNDQNNKVIMCGYCGKGFKSNISSKKYCSKECAKNASKLVYVKTRNEHFYLGKQAVWRKNNG